MSIDFTEYDVKADSGVMKRVDEVDVCYRVHSVRSADRHEGNASITIHLRLGDPEDRVELERSPESAVHVVCDASDSILSRDEFG